jgi:hypothetical protein
MSSNEHRKLGFLKKIFYPFVLLISKTGLFPILVPAINWTMKKSGLKKRYNKYPEHKMFGNFFRNNFDSKELKEKEVLFISTSGVDDAGTFRNLMLSKFFKKKDYKPVFMVCNKTFDICNRDKVYRDRNDMLFYCYECYGGYKYIEKETGLEIRYLNSYMDEQIRRSLETEINAINKLANVNECIDHVFNGLPLGVLTKRSVLYYLTQGLFFNNQLELESYKRYLKSSAMFALIFEKELSQNTRIKYIVLNNGQLSFDLIASEMAKKKGIDYITQETFEAPNSWLYKKNGIAIELNWEKEWRSFNERTTLTPHQKQKVVDFMENRQVGKNMIITMNDPNTPKILDNKKERYVALFTNFTWDTTVLDRNSIFTSMNEWLNETIDFWIKNVEGIKLIVRAHPAEVKLTSPSAQYIRDIIKDRIPNEKIVFFDSTDKVNSYEIINNIDYGVCYSSSIGLEIAFTNKASIVAGLPYYRNKKGVESPQNRSEYFELLRKLNKDPENYQKHSDELLKYLYFIFFERIKGFKGFEFNYFEARAKISSPDPKALLNDNEDLLEEFYKEITSN